MFIAHKPGVKHVRVPRTRLNIDLKRINYACLGDDS